MPMFELMLEIDSGGITASYGPYYIDNLPQVVASLNGGNDVFAGFASLPMVIHGGAYA